MHEVHISSTFNALGYYPGRFRIQVSSIPRNKKKSMGRMENHYDVIVVSAGAAGLMCARCLIFEGKMYLYSRLSSKKEEEHCIDP